MISKIKRKLLKKHKKWLSTLSVAVLVAAVSPINVFALPEIKDATGATMVNSSSTHLTINQTANTVVLTWNNFDIAQGETITINQPNANAIAVIQIQGNNASQILGKLKANGQVCLQNSNGTLFGPDSQVEVGGLVATTLNTTIDSNDTYNLNKDSNTIGKIVNNGIITTTNGQVALIAPQVENYGTITGSNDGIIDTGANNAAYNLCEGDKLVTLHVNTTGDVINTSDINTAAAISDQDGLVILEGAITSSSNTTVSGKNILIGKAALHTSDLSLQATDNMILIKQAALKINRLNANAGKYFICSGSIYNDSSANMNIAADVVIMQNYSNNQPFSNYGSTTGSIVANKYGFYDGDYNLEPVVTKNIDNISYYTTKQTYSYEENTYTIDVKTRSTGLAGLNSFVSAINNDYYSFNDSSLLVQNGGVIFALDSDYSIKQVILGTKVNTQLGSDGFTSIGENGILVKSSHYDNDRGAITMVDSQNGRGIEKVSADNSFIGTNPGGKLGGNGDYVTKSLPNGNLVVNNPQWNNNRGLITLINTTTISDNKFGVLSDSNSFIGNPGDKLSLDSNGYTTTTLSNNNLVVYNPQWNNSCGIATFINTNMTASNKFGILSEVNSLKGSNPGDKVGLKGVTELNDSTGAQSFDNYIVISPSWQSTYNHNRGAVTWGSGDSGITGTILPNNSLLGSSDNDNIASYGVYVLKNGNYLVLSPQYNYQNIQQAGAITFGCGNQPLIGIVDPSLNSLIGSNTNDQVGKNIKLLPSPDRSTAYQGNGNVDINKTISQETTLKGGIQEFTDGNFAIILPSWNSGKGAVCFGNNTYGITGQVTSLNAVTGFFRSNDVVPYNGNGVNGTATIEKGDQFGSGGVVDLDGKYIIFTPNFFDSRGQVLFVDAIPANNFLQPSSSWIQDWIQNHSFAYMGILSKNMIGSGGIVDLGNNKLALLSPSYGYVDQVEVTLQNPPPGIDIAKTFGDVKNAFTGSPGDLVADIIGGIQSLGGPSTTTQLQTQDITLAGAVTVIDTTQLNSITFPFISAINSLIGASITEKVGSQVRKLSNGNLLVADPLWGRDVSNSAMSNSLQGALAFINRDKPPKGQVTAENSFVGRRHPRYLTYLPQGDDYHLITDISQVYEVGNSNYLLANPNFQLYIMRFGTDSWHALSGFTCTPKMGIIALGDGNTGLTGEVGDKFSSNKTSDNYDGAYSIAATNYVTGYIDTRIGATVERTDLAAGLNVTVNIDGSFLVSNPNYNNYQGVRIWGDGNHSLFGRLPLDVGSGGKLDDGYNHYGPIKGANTSNSPSN